MDVTPSFLSKFDPSNIKHFVSFSFLISELKNEISEFKAADMEGEYPFEDVVNSLAEVNKLLERELRTFGSIIREFSDILGIDLDPVKLSRVLDNDDIVELSGYLDKLNALETMGWGKGTVDVNAPLVSQGLQDSMFDNVNVGKILETAMPDVIGTMKKTVSTAMTDAYNQFKTTPKKFETFTKDLSKVLKEANTGKEIVDYIQSTDLDIHEGLMTLLNKMGSPQFERVLGSLDGNMAQVASAMTKTVGIGEIDIDWVHEKRRREESELDPNIKFWETPFKWLADRLDRVQFTQDPHDVGMSEMPLPDPVPFVYTLSAAEALTLLMEGDPAPNVTGFMNYTMWEPKNLYKGRDGELTGQFGTSFDREIKAPELKVHRMVGDIADENKKELKKLKAQIDKTYDTKTMRGWLRAQAEYTTESLKLLGTAEILYEYYSAFSDSPVSFAGFVRRDQVDMISTAHQELQILEQEISYFKGKRGQLNIAEQMRLLDLTDQAKEAKRRLQEMLSTYTSLVDKIAQYAAPGTTADTLFRVDDSKLHTLLPYINQIEDIKQRLSELPTTGLSIFGEREKQMLLDQLKDYENFVRHNTMTISSIIESTLAKGEGLDFNYFVKNYNENDFKNMAKLLTEEAQLTAQIEARMPEGFDFSVLKGPKLDPIDYEKFKKSSTEFANTSAEIIEDIRKSTEDTAKIIGEEFQYAETVLSYGETVADKFRIAFETGERAFTSATNNVVPKKETSFGSPMEQPVYIRPPGHGSPMQQSFANERARYLPDELISLSNWKKKDFGSPMDQQPWGGYSTKTRSSFIRGSGVSDEPNLFQKILKTLNEGLGGKQCWSIHSSDC